MVKESIVCSLSDSDQYKILNFAEKGNYVIEFSRLSDTWYYNLCDLMGFFMNGNTKVCLNINDNELRFAKSKYGKHRFDEAMRRNYEPKVLVHSTSKENMKYIFLDGELKSWNILKSEKVEWEKKPIGNMLGDLEDFSNYIMFSNIDFNNEIIVASKQEQKVDIYSEQLYKPGVRFYFDCEKMARDGLILRDGIHIKVENRLKLDKYLIWYSTAEKIDIDEYTTPHHFWKKSNDKFMELFPQYI